MSNIHRGDIYDVDWSPSRGSEQAGVRPSLVIQNNIGNGVTAYPVTIVLTISSKLKGYPSMVRVEPTEGNGLSVTSEINTGQVMTIDKNRLGKYWGFLSVEDMKKVEEKLAYILGLKIAD
ncbi:MAG: type II toxin-antitoxin system PemK/MazF family toxin [Capsulimonas sp.]|uniref:type II toxin-antitoxin system PemK/MazF family toxin n=1 Tax=Capsulimonas sp. TaxID=2494211 RepID=UPI003265AA32